MISLPLRNMIRDDLDRWEGYYAWMYLDSVGLVTIGYGTMLADASAAVGLSFTHLKGRPATAAEIRAAYNAVKAGSATQKGAAPKQKFGAKHYEKITDLRITQGTASQLRDAHVDADYRQLLMIYPDFDAFPDAAKLALFDMIYNLGAGHGKARHQRASGLRGYPTMNGAINCGDWATAARQCHRHGIPDARNAATAALFKSCAEEKAEAAR